MSCFGMGIKLFPQEKEELKIFLDTAMFSTTLINDFYSWPKEIKHNIETPGSERPFNAVAILMRHSGLSEKEAMQKLREKQIEIQENHLALLQKLESEKEIPENHMLYILAAQYAASGSEFWSIHVPRYPSKEDLSQPEVEFVSGAFRYKTEKNGTRVAVEIQSPAAGLNGNSLPNGHTITNGHSTTNGHVYLNGRAPTNGHASTNGHVSANGHSSTNGHCLSNGKTLKKRKSNLKNSISLSNGHAEVNVVPKKRLKGSHAMSEEGGKCSDHVSQPLLRILFVISPR